MKFEPPSPAPGFMVLQGNRLEDLCSLWVAQLRREPLGPLEPEVVLVQSNGMKHWLEHALAADSALGICAATRMELPSAFLWQAYRAVLGPEAVPARLPLDKDLLTWRLYRLLPTLVAARTVYAPLQRYMASGGPGPGGSDPRRRYQLAQQLADVLDGYQSYRADWLAAWAAGELLGVEAGKEAQAEMLGSEGPHHEVWQAQLWRDLLEDLVDGGQAGLPPAGPLANPIAQPLASPAGNPSRSAVHQRFMQAMQGLGGGSARHRPAGLPPRITVFGISSLPLQAVEALAALGGVCQVLMVTQNPCQYHWADVVDGREELSRELREQRRADSQPPRQPLRAGLEQAHALSAAQLGLQAHPLLAAWGRQGRDYLHLLADFDLPGTYRQRLATIDLFHDPAEGTGQSTTVSPPPTRLARLQSDLLHLRPAPAQPEAVPPDGSIELVQAYSAQREVEILHDRLLAWLDQDAALQPEDVLVMVPDVAVFAPHIQAVFGRFAPGQPRHIPFSVADVGQAESPLALAVAQLLELPASPVALSDWAALFDVPAVRQRFGLDEAEVGLLQQWLHEAGVRWGLDATHRQHWGWDASLPDVAQNTWSFGLRRLLLGHAMGSQALWRGVAALPASTSLSVRLLGALADWLDAMDETLRVLSVPHTPDDWLLELRALLERFLLPETDAEQRQLDRMLQPLQRWHTDCKAVGLTEAVALEVVRDHWTAQWKAPSLSQRFFGGGVQFATLMPMRTIPFRVVCLLGMNDGDYPRRVSPRDFDLMARQMRPGDRSRREDDRYLFLEALLSARERFYLSWQGRNASDDTLRPPSVLVAQLLDALGQYWTPPPEPRLYPLQPFSARAFQAPGSYADDWAALHRAGWDAPGQTPAQSTVSTDPTVPTAPATTVTLPDLERFVREPVEWTLRDGLRVYLSEPEGAADDTESFGLSTLELHGAVRRLVGAALEQEGLQELDALQAEGALPLAGFGAAARRKLEHTAQQLLGQMAVWRRRFPHTATEPLRAEVLVQWAAVAGAQAHPQTTSISGSLAGLWCSEPAPEAPFHDGALPTRPPHWLQWAVWPTELVNNPSDGGRRVPRLDTLRSLWVRHVWLSAAGHRVTSVVVAPRHHLQLAPLEAAVARQQLADWLAGMDAARHQPLNLSARVALRYLQERARTLVDEAKQRGEDGTTGHPSTHLRALDYARKAFQGSAPTAETELSYAALQAQAQAQAQSGAAGSGNHGERARSPYLHRLADDFGPMAEALPQWAPRLYGLLVSCASLELPQAASGTEPLPEQQPAQARQQEGQRA